MINRIKKKIFIATTKIIIMITINILKACLTARESATAVEVGLGVWVAQ